MDDLSQCRMGRVTDIVRDLTEYTEDEAYRILLRRGVFKWFAVRRQVIKLKNRWRGRLTGVYATLNHKNPMFGPIDREERAYWKGYIRGVEQCRADIRALCHQDRAIVQDNDKAAQRWLERELTEHEVSDRLVATAGRE